MELSDALRRVVGQHWRLLGWGLVSGLALGLLFIPHGTTYSASARLVLDTPDPVSRQQSTAIADTAKAIATGPSQVSRALHQAGAVRGDPALYAKQHVSVTALGTSSVLELTVSDRGKNVASAVANALASLLIDKRLQLSNEETNRVFADLDRRSAKLSRNITKADQDVNSLSLQIAAAPSPGNANVLRAKSDAALRQRDFFVQQRNVLESERVSLLSTRAQRPRPSIISAATPSAKPEASHTMVYLVLGALVGLILGMGAAGFLETLRPTLVGSDMLAGELDAALLGTLTSGVSAAAPTDIGARLVLAAEAAQVGNVALFAAGPDLNLDRLAESLSSSTSSSATARGAHTNGNGSANGRARPLRIERFKAEHPPVNNGARSGIVLVSPTALRKTELREIAHLLKMSQLPLLGLITYAPGAARDLGGKNRNELRKGSVSQ